MYTLTYLYTSIYQIKQSVLLSYVLIVLSLKIPHECGGHVTLSFNFKEPIHIRVPFLHTSFYKY